MNNFLQTVDVNYALAFLAGILAFFSPCTFPLLPSFFAMITNISFNEINEKKTNIISANINIKKEKIKNLENYNFKIFNKLKILKILKIIVPLFMFSLGFTLVFIILGASSTLLGKIFIKYRKIYIIIGSILIILFGLFLSGLIKFDILNYEKKLKLKNNTNNILFPFLFGITFAFGWSPCLSPILASILVIASSYNSIFKGITLLFTFSLSYSLMFLIFGLVFYFSINSIKFINKSINKLKLISSIILIFYGLYFFIKNII